MKRHDAQAQNWIGTHSSAALESVADKAGSTARQAGVADAGAVAEIIYHGPQVQGRERELSRKGMDFWNLQEHPPTRPHLLLYPKQFR